VIRRGGTPAVRLLATPLRQTPHGVDPIHAASLPVHAPRRSPAWYQHLNPIRPFRDLYVHRQLLVQSARRDVEARYRGHGGSDAVRAQPFDAIELLLARWWLEP
jgi:hypothetical protein